MSRTTRACLLVFATTLSVGVFVYDVIPQCAVHPCGLGQQAVTVVNSDPAPFRYRILSRLLPALIVATPTDRQAMAVSLLLHVLCFAAIYAGLYSWLKRWSDDNRALVGVFLFAAFLPLAFHIYALTTAAILEVVLVLWALILIDRFKVVAVLLVFAALNRETAVLIPLAYVAFYPSQWKRWGGLGLIYAAITAGLHIWLGAAPHVLGFEGTFAYNQSTISNAFFVNLLIAPLWVMVGINYRHSPAVLRRLCWVALLYAGSVVIGGAWEEARLQLVILPLVLPVVVSSGQVTSNRTATV